MNSSSYAIQIIPDLTIDDKYSAIIGEALNRITHFTGNALRDDRVGELFVLERSRMDARTATQILKAKGRLVTGFQFESRKDSVDDNFRVYVRKLADGGKIFKFYLTPAVQEIMLQLISLEDRRTVAIFSMLNSSLDVGYRILTTLYGNQLKRLLDKVPAFLTEGLTAKIEKLSARSAADSELWKEAADAETLRPEPPKPGRPGSQDNILQVLADDSVFEEITHYVEHIISRSDRIREKRIKLEQNPDMPRHEIYEKMIREDLDHLENCYARIHIYLKAFYKNKDRRTVAQNRILRQFFAGQIEQISGETGLLEDLLSLNEDEYFRNIARHQELSAG
ncbi:MAG: hypothetical protein RDU20_07310 [Desulfomonilaceae bacterium]|nr:hypothetical protein [Desulfomonilaceae bacterium]